MSGFVDLTGQRFGRLLVVARVENGKHRQARFFCKCVCGGEKVTNGYMLRNGTTRSCGCLHSEAARVNAKGKRTHGHSVGGRTSPTYNAWTGMRARCTNPNDTNFPRYGGRGIGIHPAWKSFEAFLSDMGERPEWATGGLDRIDVNGDYTPTNCRWATASEQRKNQRPHLRRDFFLRALLAEVPEDMRTAVERAFHVAESQTQGVA